MEPAPAMLNAEQRLYIDTYGMTHPVVLWFDSDGDECSGPDDAVSFVAGSGATWFAHRLDEFSEGEGRCGKA